MLEKQCSDSCSACVITTDTLAGIPALHESDAVRLHHAVSEALRIRGSFTLLPRGMLALAPSLWADFWRIRGVADWHQLLLPTAGALEAAGTYVDQLGYSHDIRTDFGNDKRRFSLGLLITNGLDDPWGCQINSRLTWLRRTGQLLIWD